MVNMNRDTFYKSSIPPEATPRPIGKYPNGRPKRIEFYIGKEMVGIRYYSHPGYIVDEYSKRDGKKHGWAYQWDRPEGIDWSEEDEEKAESEAALQFIPTEAIAKVDQTYRNGRPMWIHYFIGEHLVGQRFVARDGSILKEYAYYDGEIQDEYARFGGAVRLSSAIPYEDGIKHGTAYQWAHDGRLMGTFTMERGTGTDLWWQELMDGEILLTEAWEEADGLCHGHEWWFHYCLPSELWIEKKWFKGNRHGIEREWNTEGKVKRGWPKYWVHDQQVDKRKYLRAAAKDPTLPAFRAEDNLPYRDFPPGVAMHLK
jgi:antitoxin component YwqK of YwqJK toxin-antitoxin module